MAGTRVVPLELGVTALSIARKDMLVQLVSPMPVSLRECWLIRVVAGFVLFSSISPGSALYTEGIQLISVSRRTL